MLVGCAVLPTAIAAASSTPVGAFRMFTAPVMYRVEAVAYTEDEVPRRVPLRDLAPHMSRDARRVIVPAHRFVSGEANAQLLEGGLRDLAELTCALHPASARTEVVLYRKDVDGKAREPARARAECGSP